jgi:hypothetical protein
MFLREQAGLPAKVLIPASGLFPKVSPEKSQLAIVKPEE